MNTINKHKLLRAVLYTGLARALARGCANKPPMNGDVSVGAQIERLSSRWPFSLVFLVFCAAGK